MITLIIQLSTLIILMVVLYSSIPVFNGLGLPAIHVLCFIINEAL